MTEDGSDRVKTPLPAVPALPFDGDGLRVRAEATYVLDDEDSPGTIGMSADSVVPARVPQ